ncbi:hypothetical protein GCM10010988_17420 [Cnuibacter physcomitrellae]|nr:hypothetical protein GCM10010988_17420 [Cnuibacter physcomitrellae]
MVSLATQKIFYRINEACELLSVSRSTFYRLVTAGHLQVVYIGVSPRVRHDDLLAFAASADRGVAL